MKKLDDIKLAAIKRDYLKGMHPKALAEQYGIGESTIRRYIKNGQWNDLLQAGQVVSSAAIASMQSDPGAIDTDQLLRTAIASLMADMGSAPIKSRESAALAIAKLIEVYRRYHPPTIDEAIDLLLALPNFTPMQFAKRLRERIESQG